MSTNEIALLARVERLERDIEVVRAHSDYTMAQVICIAALISRDQKMIADAEAAADRARDRLKSAGGEVEQPKETPPEAQAALAQVQQSWVKFYK